MSNTIELMDSIIGAAQTLVDGSRQNEFVQTHSTSVLKMAESIRTELDSMWSNNGSLAIDPQVTLHYTRAPFAIVATRIYLLKKKYDLDNSILSTIQLELINAIESKIGEVKKQLDEIWGAD